MALVLAIEPDRKQASAVRRLIRDRHLAELVLVDTKDAAVAAIAEAIPDLILVTALFSPHEEEELSGYLRTLDEATHLQTLTIPQLASASRTSSRRTGLFKPRARRAKKKQPEGCAPAIFANEIATYLERALEVKASRKAIADEASTDVGDFFTNAQQEAVEQEVEETTTVRADRPVPGDDLTTEVTAAQSTDLQVDAPEFTPGGRTDAEPEAAPQELLDATLGPAVVETASAEASTPSEDPQPTPVEDLTTDLTAAQSTDLQADAPEFTPGGRTDAEPEAAPQELLDATLGPAVVETASAEASAPSEDPQPTPVEDLTTDLTAAQSTDLQVDAPAFTPGGRTDAEPEAAPQELLATQGPEVVEQAPTEATNLSEDQQPSLQQVCDALLQDDFSSLALSGLESLELLPSAPAAPDVAHREADEQAVLETPTAPLVVEVIDPEEAHAQETLVDAREVAPVGRADAEPEAAPQELLDAALGPAVVETAPTEATNLSEDQQPSLQQVCNALLQDDSSSLASSGLESLELLPSAPTAPDVAHQEADEQAVLETPTVPLVAEVIDTEEAQAQQALVEPPPDDPADSVSSSQLPTADEAKPTIVPALQVTVRLREKLAELRRTFRDPGPPPEASTANGEASPSDTTTHVEAGAEVAQTQDPLVVPTSTLVDQENVDMLVSDAAVDPTGLSGTDVPTQPAPEPATGVRGIITEASARLREKLRGFKRATPVEASAADPDVVEAPVELVEVQEAPGDTSLSDWPGAESIVIASEEGVEIEVTTDPLALSSHMTPRRGEVTQDETWIAPPVERDLNGETALDALEVPEWHCMPLATWAYQENAATDGLDTSPHHSLRTLMEGLSVPLDVASVGYASGCWIHRVRVTGGKTKKKARGRKDARDPVVILSKKALREALPKRARRPAKAKRASGESLATSPDSSAPPWKRAQKGRRNTAASAR